jgi:hypothetical protein
LNHSTRFAASLLLSLVASLPARAGRPLQTEDAAVLERGACELEGAWLRQRGGDEPSQEQTLGTVCGIGWTSQVGLTLARDMQSDPRGQSLTVGGKTSLWQGAGDDAAALTLAWGLASARDNGHWRSSRRALNLVFSLPLGPGIAHVNLGRVRELPVRTDSRTWSLAFEHKGFEAGGLNWAPMAELFGAQGAFVWWNIALRVTVWPEKLFIDTSWGRPTGPHAAQLLTTGFKLAF